VIWRLLFFCLHGQVFHFGLVDNSSRSIAHVADAVMRWLWGTFHEEPVRDVSYFKRFRETECWEGFNVLRESDAQGWANVEAAWHAVVGTMPLGVQLAIREAVGAAPAEEGQQLLPARPELQPEQPAEVAAAELDLQEEADPINNILHTLVDMVRERVAQQHAEVHLDALPVSVGAPSEPGSDVHSEPSVASSAHAQATAPWRRADGPPAGKVPRMPPPPPAPAHWQPEPGQHWFPASPEAHHQPSAAPDPPTVPPQGPAELRFDGAAEATLNWWGVDELARTALLLLQGRSNRGRAAANDILHKLLRKRMNNEHVTNPSAFVVSCVENAYSRLRGHQDWGDD
jgi:hypothetical protein